MGRPDILKYDLWETLYARAHRSALGPHQSPPPFGVEPAHVPGPEATAIHETSCSQGTPSREGPDYVDGPLATNLEASCSQCQHQRPQHFGVEPVQVSGPEAAARHVASCSIDIPGRNRSDYVDGPLARPGHAASCSQCQFKVTELTGALAVGPNPAPKRIGDVHLSTGPKRGEKRAAAPSKVRGARYADEFLSKLEAAMTASSGNVPNVASPRTQEAVRAASATPSATAPANEATALSSQIEARLPHSRKRRRIAHVGSPEGRPSPVSGKKPMKGKGARIEMEHGKENPRRRARATPSREGLIPPPSSDPTSASGTAVSEPAALPMVSEPTSQLLALDGRRSTLGVRAHIRELIGWDDDVDADDPRGDIFGPDAPEYDMGLQPEYASALLGGTSSGSRALADAAATRQRGRRTGPSVHSPTANQHSPTCFIPPDKNISGSATLQAGIRQVCEKYRRVFNTKLNPQPAMVEPMELHVDLAKWRTNKTRGPARVRSTEQNAEVRRQVEMMLAAGVIAGSQAQHYSHPHLPPKKVAEGEPKKWRFALDYRMLNAASEGLGWPLPNIQQALQRIGQQRPCVFGKLDLTHGYHQMPMAKASQQFTAFITFMGVFEFLRVPMGLKGAGSYFQKVLATVVLAGLIYASCELYIDDILIHGRNEAEFLERLAAVLGRLDKYRLTVNPDKVFLGFSEIEYVGHVVSDKGISFSKERRQKVLDIEEPTWAKDLKSFLGVAVYFHEHLRDFAILAHPLHQMILHYDKSKAHRLEWTEETRTAFQALKHAINELPLLYFLDDVAPVYLMTDASDYGIGAYLYQLRDGREFPIAFMSKALDARESRWSTLEKECYAIVCALRKFRYLLSGRKFTLRTDHKNLVYMGSEANAKVFRWKTEISEYDCEVEYIPGPDNVVADAMSRVLNTQTSGTVAEDVAVLAMMNLDIREDVPYSSVHAVSAGFASLAQQTTAELHVRQAFAIPVAERRIIGTVHNAEVGHHGVDRSVRKLTQLGHNWQYMREHVKRFIKECPCCQKMRYVKPSVHTHPFTVATYAPMERLGIDTIGPLTESTNGYKYILVIICCFTRWVEMFPLRGLTMEEAAHALRQHFGRFGVPSQVITDNGTQFKNNTVSELLGVVGTQHITTLAYSKEENALVERANLEVMRHMRNIVYHKNMVDAWEENLPVLQRIMNSAWKESNSTSPAELLFGTALCLDRRLYREEVELPLDIRTDLSQWAAEHLVQQERLMQIAEQVQKNRDNDHVTRGSPLRTRYEPGEYVLVNYRGNPLRKGPPSKFMSYLRGPLRVLGRSDDNPDEYILQNLVLTNGAGQPKEERVHVTNMRIFLFDAQTVDPQEVATRDDVSSFVVESIVAHVGHPSRRSEMDFRVRWRDYPDPNDDYWLPYKEISNLDAAREYFWNNNLRALIPKKLRTGRFA